MARRTVCLTEEQAIEIYQWKLDTVSEYIRLGEVDLSVLKGKSLILSKVYEVSPKTIRDIWNRNTWIKATSSLWASEDPIFSEKFIQVTSVVLLIIIEFNNQFYLQN